MAQGYRLRSGGRTRHIVNIAGPSKTGDIAYTFTEATSAPSAATIILVKSALLRFGLIIRLPNSGLYYRG
mgnify:CR=1 FL=1